MITIRRSHIRIQTLRSEHCCRLSARCVAFLAAALLILAAPQTQASSFLPDEPTKASPEVLDLLSTLDSGHTEILIDDMMFRVDDLSRSGFTGTRWTDGIVYYSFDASVTAANQTAWLAAAANWSAVADLTFVPRTTETNYINVFTGTGNWSYVGMIGGSQDMSIFSWGWEFIIAHEIGHALGLSHEHSRSDRGTFVQIHLENVNSTCGPANDESCAHNFEVRATTNYGAYDFDSVMHYSRCTFTIGPCPDKYTISAQPAYVAFNSLMGQRDHLSTADQAGMVSRYGAAVSAIFSDGFEVGNTSRWSQVFGLKACVGQTCGNYTHDCNLGNPSCACYLTYSGGGACALPTFCPLSSDCFGDHHCLFGQVCIVDTCCPGNPNICVTPSCASKGTTDPFPEGAVTTASCR